jgi:hypothetical protein
LRNENEQLRINRDIKNEHTMSKKQEQIEKLKEEKENNEVQAKNRYDALLESKLEMERTCEERISQMERAHKSELKKRKEEYDEKMEADSIRYQELLNQKEDESKKYNERLNELYIHHTNVIKQLNAEHKIELEKQISETNSLKSKMEAMCENHKGDREKIENEAWNKIDEIKEKNKEELAKITEAGLRSKADLQLINNKYMDSKKQKDQLIRDIQEKQTHLNSQIQLTNNMKQEIDG